MDILRYSRSAKNKMASRLVPVSTDKQIFALKEAAVSQTTRPQTYAGLTVCRGIL
jgi:hypothetical protein